ncbi:MAG: hypothetical protein RR047_02465, partial [Bacilli bacterium]
QTINYSVTDSYNQTVTSSRIITVYRFYVLNLADQYPSITGGYGRYITQASPYYGGTKLLFGMDGGLYGSVVSGPMEQRNVLSGATNNPINLSKYKRIGFSYSLTDAVNSFEVGCYRTFTKLEDALAPSIFARNLKVTGSNSSNEVLLDIPSNSAPCYIGAVMWATDANNPYTRTWVAVRYIWLE